MGDGRFKTSIRLSPTERALLKRAGELTGRKFQDFLRRAAVTEAQRIISEEARKNLRAPRRAFGDLISDA